MGHRSGKRIASKAKTASYVSKLLSTQQQATILVTTRVFSRVLLALYIPMFGSQYYLKTLKNLIAIERRIAKAIRTLIS